MRLGHFRHIVGAATLLAMCAGLFACAGIHDDRDADTVSLIGRGDALYAEGKYSEAYDAFNAAAKTVDGKDDELYIKAGTRAADAFCMSQFAGARADLAAGDLQLALLRIDTALADSACLAFADEVKWAREQRSLLQGAPR
jgi:tetratricopeptide (TPR) repeat protein